MKNTLEMQVFYDYFLKLKKRLTEIFPQTRKNITYLTLTVVTTVVTSYSKHLPTQVSLQVYVLTKPELFSIQ